MKNPTIVIVPGAMHCVDHYKPLMEYLESNGYTCVVATLPSTQSVESPPAGLADDTAAVRTVVCRELDNYENDVLVLAHSYGGVPANNALQGLDAKTRLANTKTNCVKALAFMCSLPVPNGSSAGAFMGARVGEGKRQGKSAVEMNSTNTFGPPKSSPGAEEALFNDLSPEEAKKWASLLRPVSMRVMMEETTYAAYADIPTGYLYCSRDESLPLDAQEYIVAEAKKAGAKIVHEETVDAGHSPFLSQIERAAAFIQKLFEVVS
jgi:pimeloyl-ACP methyl ester carboxylesterase